jgi:hypothetical protein
MNNKAKLVLVLTPLLLVASCASGNELTLANGEQLLVAEVNGVTTLTNNQIFNQLYRELGPEIAANELVNQIALDVYAKSGRGQADWDARVNEVFDAFMSPSYYNAQQFDERIMAAALLSQGFDITCNTTPFIGTKADLPIYGNLRSALTCDYSDFINRRVNRDIGVSILNEEFILSQRATFFANKQIREVKYFVFDPVGFTSAEQFANDYSAKFQTGTSFENIVLGVNGLENEWRNLKFEDTARDFAVIDFTKSTKFTANYIDIFNTSALSAAARNDLTTKINEYTNNGAHPITHGFEVKNREIENTNYYFSKVGTNEGQVLVLPDLDTRIFRVGSSLLLDNNGYLRVQSDSNVIANRGSDGKYYIIQVGVIDASSNLDSKRRGAKALALNSSNTRGAIRYWLEQYNVEAYDEELYDYLDSTFGFGG